MGTNPTPSALFWWDENFSSTAPRGSALPHRRRRFPQSGRACGGNPTPSAILRRRQEAKNALRSSQSGGRDQPFLPGYEWHAHSPPSPTMFYVSLLRSEASPNQVYTGFTEDLRQRLKDHNAGKSTHTAKYRPWILETYLAFSDRPQALDFERYLKTASGIAFANKRLRPRRH